MASIENGVPGKSAVISNGNAVHVTNGFTSLPNSFMESVKRDIKAVEDVEKELDPAELNHFIDLLEECGGQLILSGVGKQIGQFTK